MTDRPILMSGPMVRAWLDGRKRQTRRLAWADWKTCTVCNGGGNCSVCDGSGETRKPTIWQKVRPGDRLWVRETWAAAPDETIFYRESAWALPVDWRPSIHMSRGASRLTLVVDETRLERLQEISFADCCAEGMDPHWFGPGCDHPECDGEHRGEKWHFLETWNSLHGPGAWDANPEVVVITATPHARNIDRMDGEAAE